jgi:cyclopropane-fatty-acyl-phospholipid synthase
MTAHAPDRGRQFRSGQPAPGLWGGIVAAPFHRALDRIDAGLEQGAIEAWLPDGSYRILGGRGPGPVCEVEVRHWRALIRLARDGSVGWYQAWAAHEWTSPDPVPLFDLFMRNGATLGKAARARGISRWTKKLRHWLRDNSPRRARKNIAFHYDLGNDFYAEWLDETMTYSSALFQEPISPDEELAYAQLNKVRALLDRLELKPDQHLLDAIASVEMVEAVGQRWWPAYLQAIAQALKPGGRAAIQYIAINDALFEDYAASADFIQTYVFPGGMLISESRFRALAEKYGLTWSDQRNFGLHYAETLKRWRERFDAAAAEGRLPAGFDRSFIDLWRYYLMYCEGGFRGGGIWVAQVTLTKGD